MYVILWEYRVRAERVAVFEEIYSAAGLWAELFQKSKGFLGTELLSDEQGSYRYITIDRWSSSKDYESFLAEWRNEYEELDGHCEGLSEREILLGKWETVLRETH